MRCAVIGVSFMPGQVVVVALANFLMGFGLCFALDMLLRVRRASRFRAEAASRLDAVTDVPSLSAAPDASLSSSPADILPSFSGSNGDYSY